MTIKDIKAAESVKDLEALGIGKVSCNLGHRGGGLGFYNADIANIVDVPECDIPAKFGAGCNYLGGGLRGSIFPSSYSDRIKDSKKIKLLDSIADACVRVYRNIENDNGLNEEEYPDGDTNWEAIGTKRARQTSVKSAY